MTSYNPNINHKVSDLLGIGNRGKLYTAKPAFAEPQAMTTSFNRHPRATAHFIAVATAGDLVLWNRTCYSGRRTTQRWLVSDKAGTFCWRAAASVRPSIKSLIRKEYAVPEGTPLRWTNISL